MSINFTGEICKMLLRSSLEHRKNRRDQTVFSNGYYRGGVNALLFLLVYDGKLTFAGMQQVENLLVSGKTHEIRKTLSAIAAQNI